MTKSDHSHIEELRTNAVYAHRIAAHAPRTGDHASVQVQAQAARPSVESSGERRLMPSD
jgi:hypothetical protein